MSLKITVLADNNSSGGFAAEHGLALLLELPSGRKWLWDAGSGETLRDNMALAGVDPAELKRVIFSHGHNDHTGGLCHLTPEEIWLLPGAERCRFSCHQDLPVKDISMPDSARKIMEKCRVHLVNGFTGIDEGLFITGPVPRNSGEDCGGPFFLDENKQLPDDIPDDCSLLYSEGVLILGCCHSGLVNTMELCRRSHPEIQVHTVIGGMHLKNSSTERLEFTIEALKRFGIRRIYAMHCTGEDAVAVLKKALPECRIFTPEAGDVIELGI